MVYRYNKLKDLLGIDCYGTVSSDVPWGGFAGRHYTHRFGYKAVSNIRFVSL